MIIPMPEVPQNISIHRGVQEPTNAGMVRISSGGGLIGVGIIFVFMLLALWALAVDSRILKTDWYASHRRAAWIGIGIFAAGYLMIHFLIFDSAFRYTTAWDFIVQGRAHILHIAPPLAVFAYFFIQEGISRFKKRQRN